MRRFVCPPAKYRLHPDGMHAPPSARSATTDHGNIHIGKAGRKRHMGIRPTVRGSVMNPNDHPHGGGEGQRPHRPSRPCHSLGQAGSGLQDP